SLLTLALLLRCGDLVFVLLAGCLALVLPFPPGSAASQFGLMVGVGLGALVRAVPLTLGCFLGEVLIGLGSRDGGVVLDLHDPLGVLPQFFQCAEVGGLGAVALPCGA